MKVEEATLEVVVGIIRGTPVVEGEDPTTLERTRRMNVVIIQLNMVR